MPAGRIHDRITLWTLPYVTVLVFALSRDGELTLLAAGGYLLGGLLLGPDLDIHSRPFKRWGPLRWIWLPYQRGLRHRSLWSHGPIVGTTLRLLYLGLWLGLGLGLGALLWGLLVGGSGWRTVAWDILEQGGARVGRSLQTHPQAYVMAYCGLEAGAMSHSLSDYIGSAVKRYQRQGWRGLWPKAKSGKKSSDKKLATKKPSVRKLSAKKRR
ncbi:metal-binding protein [Prochlorothrix hollandica]|uniref:Metal-binding protein n=1 Tax=Prochlorothrix hollandica PCC 9006 = CALU 1027 TaxID=317619 RepID=A0A0M2PY40_PROHO|nr:metal-binding protein [Prochlorothrix hollandica]KKI99997.1 hypothetical protein PROH_09460 [Prochlorothrix hollandica PCC 9006 = CALU 1027]